MEQSPATPNTTWYAAIEYAHKGIPENNICDAIDYLQRKAHWVGGWKPTQHVLVFPPHGLFDWCALSRYPDNIIVAEVTPDTTPKESFRTDGIMIVESVTVKQHWKIHDFPLWHDAEIRTQWLARHPAAFKYCPRQFHSPELCMAVVNYSPHMIKLIPPESLTLALCRAAFQRDSTIVNSLPIDVLRKFARMLLGSDISE
jgi:hypothetical protein